jgi:hypothetical protein
MHQKLSPSYVWKLIKWVCSVDTPEVNVPRYIRVYSNILRLNYLRINISRGYIRGRVHTAHTLFTFIFGYIYMRIDSVIYTYRWGHV